MTNEEFIERIRKAVYEPVVDGSVEMLQRPPGRRPSPTLTELSQWFNRLLPEDREHVHRVIQMVARAAVFEMCAVLDGVTAIRESNEPLGLLELRYKMGEESFLLNDPATAPLHDLFAEQVPLP
jgi:hypothetical protein